MKKKDYVLIFIILILLWNLGKLWNETRDTVWQRRTYAWVYQETFTAPNDEYALKWYLFLGNATTDFGVSVDVCNISCDYWLDRDYIRTIYWEYPARNVEIEWIDDYLISINGNILDVRYSTFNKRVIKR